jgi:hypothetical protein
MMARTKIVIIVSIVLFCNVGIGALYMAAKRSLKNDQNFERNFKHDFIKMDVMINIKKGDYYIAGVTKTHLFLALKEKVNNLIEVTEGLTDTLNIKLTVDGLAGFNFVKPYVQIDSPFFYIKDGHLPGIYKGNIDTWEARRVLPNSPPFTQAVSVQGNSFAIQTILGNRKGNIKENVLAKVTTDSPYVTINRDLLENQIDSFYSTAGTLRYSEDLSQLVYTYFYRNQYLIVDTSMNLLYRGNTIDNVKYAKIKPVAVSANTFTLASPPSIVNENTQTFGKYLFVHSKLMSRNENIGDFQKSSVIDVYNLISHEYEFSFYIPNYDEEAIKGFRICNKKLYALYGQYLVCYNIEDFPSL